ncbi:MAG: transporter substrate-binding domain-containing protein [Bacteroidetes bacterium]|nr:transporter substrate-binding domain-containing protein [Bacteroidota bacterium]
MQNKDKYIIICIHILFFIYPFKIVSTEKLTDGTLTSENNTPHFNIELTEEEKNWLKQHPVIKVGSDPNWAPFEFRDKKGNFHGMIIDYLKIIEKNLHVEFDFAQDETWEEMFIKAKNKDLDIISNITQTPERSESLNFTTPYIQLPVSVFAMDDKAYIQNLSELKGKKVAVVSSYITHENLKKDYPEIIIVPVKNIQEGLKKVHKKNVEAFVGGMVTATYYIYEKGYKSIRIIGETPYQFRLSMGVRKDWTILLNILQKSIDSISESEKNNIYNNWIALKTKKFDYSILWKIITPLLLILVITIYWNRKLSVEIQKRKKAQNELNKAFKKLKETQTHLVQTEKMASVGLLTAGIAHEIKNPLNFITLGAMGITDAVETIIAVADKYEEYLSEGAKKDIAEIEKLKKELDYNYFKKESPIILKHMQEGVDRINEITQSLNSFSRISNNEKTLADINEGIELSLILLKNQYKYDIEIIKNLNKLPKIKCFPGKLNQVFVNIIANAIQSIDDTGTIWISTTYENNMVKISIRDSGCGIEADKLKKIFDSFYTTKPVDQGTGLGLAISKNIIDEHNGNIEVKSQVGIGTEFIITIPFITS